MEPIETIKQDDKSIAIYQDEDCSSPREDDNLGTMLCFHKRYSLGDTNHYKAGDYDDWKAVEAAIYKNEDPAVVLPLFLYDHSGITIRTTSFNDPWDSGQVGLIFISKAKVRHEYSAKRISKKLRDRVAGYLVAEVETYDQYLRGECYGYVTTDADGKETDSCWGFIGLEHLKAELGVTE